MEKLSTYIESILFVAQESVTFSDLKTSLQEVLGIELSDQQLSSALDQLIVKYQDEAFSFELSEVDNGFRFMSKPEYHHVIGAWLKTQSNKKLSKAAMETLSIIAYKQPVSKTEIESIRGVNSDYTVQKLLEKELCEIVGRDEGPGRPLLYGTTSKFMNYFGLKDITDLPKLKEVEVPDDNSIGQPEDFDNREIMNLNEEE